MSVRKGQLKLSKSVKHISEVKIPAEYELVSVTELKDMKSLGIYLRHKKSGARVALISNEDDNKVFYIGFRTPSDNSTGVAHIIEHTVLCGSEKFPSKDPFVELVKGSLNTFLNAVTYPDKTLYPVASCNDKDFKNLTHVYLDAVFYPNLYKNRAIFEQEGWHYELDEETGELKINGVVYNEMKGALSSPDTIEGERVNEALFPDTVYKEESGGDPDVIPELTYEDYLDFHRKYYHPSNSYIYLYGDFDIEERLAFLNDNYLKNFDKTSPDSEIYLQKPVKSDIEATYSIAESEDDKEKTFLSYNVVTGESKDLMLTTSLQLIQYVMTDAPGAPVKKALTEAGIGNEISAGFMTSQKQPVLSVNAAGSEPERKDEFVKIIENTFEEAVKNGISKDKLLAAINYSEFKYREQDYGRYPKGLLAGLKMCESWLYDENSPFELLDKGWIFDELRGKAGTGYYEGLIEKYILKNEHKAIVTLVPEKGKNDRKEAELKKKLAQKRAYMTEKEIEELRKSTERLKEFQEKPSTKEELEAIPMLERSDIGKESKPLKNDIRNISGVPVILHDVYTNGIIYFRLNFELSDCKEEELPYIALLSELYGMTDTAKRDYSDFVSETLTHTGGINSDFVLYTNVKDMALDRLDFSVDVKTLAFKFGKALELMEEMLYTTEFNEKSDKRILEILKENLIGMQMSLEASGDRTAVTKGQAHFSVAGIVGDKVKGVGYYRFIKELSENFEDKKEALYETLNGIIRKYFVKSRALISFTAENKVYEEANGVLLKMIKNLPDTENETGKNLPSLLKTRLEEEKRDRKKPYREAYTASGQVQYAVRSGNFKEAGLPYTGLLSILQVILSYDYLWINVRVKGGAYGSGMRFDRNGDMSFSSYRDPNLLETDAVYEGIPDYIDAFEADERTMTKYVIGTISNIDLPLTPYMEGERSLNAYLKGMTDEDILKARTEILSATDEDIRGLSKYARAVLDGEVFTVVGSEAKIKENEEKFDSVTSLLA